MLTILARMEVDHFALCKVLFIEKYHFCVHGTVRKIMKFGEGGN